MTIEDKTIAVLIDADNADARLLGAMLSELKKHGIPKPIQVYGDFSKPNLKNWNDLEHRHRLDLRHTNHLSNGKNATDIFLAVDAMDLLYGENNRNFWGICIVSSDSDFTYLAKRISKDKKVIGIGRRNTVFSQACDVWISTDTLEEEEEIGTAVPPSRLTASTFALPAAPKKPAEPVELKRVRQAYDRVANEQKLRDKDGWVLLAALGDALRALNPSETAYIYGSSRHATLKKMIKAMMVDYPVIELKNEGAVESVRILP